MKIVLISLASRGGMLHFQVELANAMSHIVSTGVLMSAAAPVSYLEGGVATRVVNTGRGALGSIVHACNPLSWYRIWKAVGTGDPDLVHVTGAHAWNPLVAVCAKLRRKPLVYTVHDPNEHSSAPLSIRISNAIMIRMAETLIVLTRHAEGELRARGVSMNKVHVIPHGVYSLFQQWQRANIRARNVILYFGRFEPYKGLETLVNAFARIRNDIPGWRLLLAGGGRLPASLRRSIPPGIEVVNGYIPDQDVAKLMQSSRLVVVPYTTATQSGVIATAYAFGRPVVATSAGGLVEMVVHGKTGLLVPPNDVAALSRAIRSLAKNPDRLRRMGREAHHIGRTLLHWDRIAKMHMELYGSVLEKRGRP